MKTAIIVLIIGACLFVGGYVIKENGEGLYNHPGTAYSLIEGRIKTGEYLKTGGIIVAIAGGLWLIVSAIQEKKK